MTRPRESLERLFERLAPLSPSERSEQIDQLKGIGSETLIQLRVLLEAHDGSSMLDRPVMNDCNDAENGDFVGRVIGPYRILEILGLGGMGAVCLAEQKEPIRRLVALKLLRADVPSGEKSERLEREVQVLGLLNSPHVATLLDAGTTSDGLPFFVMEYVRGVSITTYCRERKIDLPTRIELFLQLCDGLVHVNSRGVIHRDIKPSNVLVSVDRVRPFVKIIDFGISKIVDPLAARGPDLTLSGVFLGTPEYMSPEQAGQPDGGIDARTDVYSAGALLRELLTERRETGGSNIELERSGVPKQLRWIVAHAMETDRSRRYRSMEEMGNDLRRYLAGRKAISSRLGHDSTRRIWRLALLSFLALCVAAVAFLSPARSGLPWIGSAAARSAHLLRVPQDHRSIQQALDHAVAGDRVLVAPGLYYENLILPDSVVLESVAGADATTIDGTFSGPVIECIGVSSATVVRGFRLTHGKSHIGGGVRCWDGAFPILEDNLIIENSAVNGGGIAAGQGSYPTIRLNRIMRNHAESAGGGIYATDGSEGKPVRIFSNTIWGNVAGPSRAAGGGVWVGGTDVSIRSNVMSQNSSSTCGGAIWAGFRGEKLILGNHLEANTALDRGGALFVDQGLVTIEGNELAANAAPENPGLCVGDQGTITIRDNRELAADRRR